MDRFDVLTLGGLVCLTIGLWLLAPWLSLTIIGAFLILLALLGARAAERAAAAETADGAAPAADR